MKERRVGSLGWVTKFSDREIVMPGLDPGIHHSKKLDRRVKPGDDE
jgi:hypothetical protein